MNKKFDAEDLFGRWKVNALKLNHKNKFAPLSFYCSCAALLILKKDFVNYFFLIYKK